MFQMEIIQSDSVQDKKDRVMHKSPALYIKINVRVGDFKPVSTIRCRISGSQSIQSKLYWPAKIICALTSVCLLAALSRAGRIIFSLFVSLSKSQILGAIKRGVHNGSEIFSFEINLEEERVRHSPIRKLNDVIFNQF